MNQNLPEREGSVPKRITWGSMWNEFLDVINFEKGVFFTLKGILLNSKQTVDDYLYGSRFSHANPIRLLLFSTALVTLLNYYFVIKPTLESQAFKDSESGISIDVGGQNGGSFGLFLTNDSTTTESVADTNTTSLLPLSEKEMDKKEQQKLLKESVQKLSEVLDKFTFALVPIFAIFTFLFFRKSGYNFTENLAINAFLVSFNNVIGILFIIPVVISQPIGSSLSSILTLVFTGYFIYKVYAIPGFKGGLKTGLAMVLSYSLYSIIVGGALIYYIYDSFEGFKA